MRQAYTVLSATYANADNTAAIAITAEAGAVAISEIDRPELWAQIAVLDVAAFVPALVPASLPKEGLT